MCDTDDSGPQYYASLELEELKDKIQTLEAQLTKEREAHVVTKLSLHQLDEIIKKERVAVDALIALAAERVVCGPSPGDPLADAIEAVRKSREP